MCGPLSMGGNQAAGIVFVVVFLVRHQQCVFVSGREGRIKRCSHAAGMPGTHTETRFQMQDGCLDDGDNFVVRAYCGRFCLKKIWRK